MQKQYRMCLLRYLVPNGRILQEWEDALYSIIGLPYNSSSSSYPKEQPTKQLSESSRHHQHQYFEDSIAKYNTQAEDNRKSRQNRMFRFVKHNPLSTSRKTSSSMPKPKRSYKIGLTISITNETQSVSTAGIFQTAFFLYDMLDQDQRHEVTFVNLASGDRNDAPSDWLLDQHHLLVNFELSLKLSLDMYIEVECIIYAKLEFHNIILWCHCFHYLKDKPFFFFFN